MKTPNTLQETPYMSDLTCTVPTHSTTITGILH